MEKDTNAPTARHYAVNCSSFFRTKVAATPENFAGQDFEFDCNSIFRDFSSTDNRKIHSVEMRVRGPSLSASSAPPSSTVSLENALLGVADVDLIGTVAPVTLKFGDPSLKSADPLWGQLECRPAAGGNTFEFQIDLGEKVGWRAFEWKRTTQGDEISSYGKAVDWLNLKMVDKMSGRVVARFVHHPLVGWKRGKFIVENDAFDGGKFWDVVVLLSGMGVLEYWRKVTGMSW